MRSHAKEHRGDYEMAEAMKAGKPYQRPASTHPPAHPPMRKARSCPCPNGSPASHARPTGHHTSTRHAK